MKVISVVSDIWSQSFYSTEASFHFNSKIYRRHGTMSPRKFRSKPEVDFRSHETEKLPPYWNSRSQPNEARCSPSLLNENWCLCDLSHGITLRTASYRFTWVLQYINEGFDRWLWCDDCEEAVSWVVNYPGVICELSLGIPQRFIAGLSQRWSPEYRVENIGIDSSKLQSGITLYKRIHNSGQNNF